MSNEYYLIDVSKCKTFDSGLIKPTLEDAVCKTPFAFGEFYNVFGQIEKYALVESTDGKWGYVSLDGKTLKLYDDAANFAGGVAAVKDGDEFYIIDENFNLISNSLVGYDGVTVCGNGIFKLHKGDSFVLAIYSE